MKKLNENQKALLSLTANALFDTPLDLPSEIEWSEIFKESVMQAVSPLVYSVAKSFVPKGIAANWNMRSEILTARSIQVFFEHHEVHQLMTDNNIPYVILKGVSSAAYYPTPLLRSMGDVDILVREDDIKRASELIEDYGFDKASEDDEKGIHIAFHRLPNSVWELHRSLNGIPNGKTGDACRKYMSDIVKHAQNFDDNGEIIKVPGKFHHGLVLLLHTASHLTSEGIGLRHLCDWAVFVSSFNSSEFVELFEYKLKECGLWQFAMILTKLSINYLGAPNKECVPDFENDFLEAIICDIFSGGNFGQKDADRYRQIKYISNRGEHTIDNKGVFKQVLNTISKKAETEQKSKAKVLSEYAKMVMNKERKLDNKKTITAAQERKDIYSRFELFETE